MSAWQPRVAVLMLRRDSDGCGNRADVAGADRQHYAHQAREWDSVCGARISINGQRLAKDLLDRVAAAAVMVALSPLLGGIALAIKLDSPGPVLYRQERIGLRGRPFAFLKFRSMIVDAEHQGLRWEVSHDDPRITRLGRWLRRYSLDELPQLI